MIDRKNGLMVKLSTAATSLNIIIYVLTMRLDPFRHENGAHGVQVELTDSILWSQGIMLVLSLLVWASGVYLFYFKDKVHAWLPWVNTLALTFASFSIISGSGGGVEFHFSIFMVIAAVAYYEDTRLILMITVLFAVQHIAGFFLFLSSYSELALIPF